LRDRRRAQRDAGSDGEVNEFHHTLHCSDEWLGLFGLFGFDAAVNGVENGEFRLLDRRDSVVDRKARFPFQPVGAAFGAIHVVIVPGLGDVRLEYGDVGGNLRFHGIPVPVGVVVGGLDFLIDLLDGRRRIGTRLLLARLDLVVRFLLRCRESIFGMLRAN
jgi:hypothetical protein